MRNLGILYVLVCALCWRVYADYDCLCNYRVETPMYAEQNENSSPVGYMYEFDCKPSISTNDVQDTWFAIMNEHAVSYVSKGDGLQVQVCAGDVPSEDKLLTTTQPSITSTSSSTQKPTSIPTSAKMTEATTTTTTTTKATTTTTRVTTKLATSTMIPITSTTSTVKPTTSTQKLTTTHPTTSSTLITSLKPTTSTPKPFTTSTMTATTSPSTVSTREAMTRTTDWLVHWNITHEPYTTQYPHTQHHYKTSKKPHHYSTDWLVNWNMTHPPFTTNYHQTSYSHGNLNLCPGLLRRSVDAKDLRQYKNHCYELVHTAKNWYNAEADCFNRIGHGGELLEIYTEDIQNYIMSFLSEINNQRYLWIGLVDIFIEEHFEWDSGARLTYTNWTPNRKGNHLPHGQEDCVMLLLSGKWDDVLCSHNGFNRRFLVNTHNINVARPYICQYPTHTPHHG